MLILLCPHCKIPVVIEELNCCIFRHGVLIETGKQIDPHLEKLMCEKLIKDNLIYGCGKPFQIVKNGNDFLAVICDYI